MRQRLGAFAFRSVRHDRAKAKAALHAALQDLAEGRRASLMAKLLECGAKHRFPFFRQANASRTEKNLNRLILLNAR